MTETKTKFKYMVVYHHRSEAGFGVGRMFVTTHRKICTQEDIVGVDDYLREENPHFTSVFVQSFQEIATKRPAWRAIWKK